MTLFRWGGKRIHFCMTNVLGTVCTKFCHNRSGFVDYISKTLWCVFSVHSVDHMTVIAAKFHPNRQSRLPLGQEKEKYGQSPIDHDRIAEDKGCCIGSGHHRFTGNVIT